MAANPGTARARVLHNDRPRGKGRHRLAHPHLQRALEAHSTRLTPYDNGSTPTFDDVFADLSTRVVRRQAASS